MNNPGSQSQYVKNLASFNTKLVNHFPNKLPNNLLRSGWSNPEFHNYFENSIRSNYSGIYLLTKPFLKTEYKKIKKSFSEKAILTVSLKYKCLAIIETFVDSNETFLNLNCEEFIPVPDYAIFKFEESIEEWKIKGISEVVILDFNSGNFTNQEKTTPNNNMPEGMQNGYSKGVTFNDVDQVIEYWLIIW